jgi:Mycobacterium 19 kDa lipoprotein antigen
MGGGDVTNRQFRRRPKGAYSYRVEKRSLIVAAVVVAVAAGSAACGQTEVRSRSSATVSIDGKEQIKTADIRCNQLESSWFLDIGREKSSANAIVEVQGDKVIAQAVRIDGIGGFTGSYWQGSESSADAKLANNTFTITGRASGTKTGTSGTVTSNFKIVARC